MRIVMSGATGLIGSELVAALERRGDTVIPLVRQQGIAKGSTASVRSVSWNAHTGEVDMQQLIAAKPDAVIHLAGESIQGRWTTAKKDRIVTSRVVGTSGVARAIASLPEADRPASFIVASAVGIYGDRGDEELADDATPGEGFLADVARQWEAAADPAREAGIRTVHMRTGIVQTLKGGGLKEALTPFKMGVGGTFGSGKQWFGWVTLHDVVRGFIHAVDSPTLSGPTNLTSPEPVTNKEWTKALGRILNRPTLFPIPQFAARAIFGEFARELYASYKVVPTRLLEDGFVFDNPEVEAALRAEMGLAD